MSYSEHDGGIEENRRRIDEIDDRLVELLNERAAHVLAIGAIKIAEGRTTFDITREGEIMARIREVNQGPMTNRELGKIFIHIMDVGRTMQNNLRAAQTAEGLRRP
jgi:chorismate mutase